MRAKEYMFVLITSICFILALISFQNACSVCKHVSEPQTEIDPFLSVTEAIEKFDTLTQGLQERIDRLDSLLMEYATENARLRLENQAYKDYIDGFWRLMEQEYDFEGHQERYMEERK
jgi:hypothetical protein